MTRTFASTLFLVALAAPGAAQQDVYDSGGPITPEQAAYDILYNDLTLTVDPADRSISGTLQTWARIVNETEWLVLDLDPLLAIESIADFKSGGVLEFDRRGGKVWINLGGNQPQGEVVRVAIAYGGRPRVAPLAPWEGGFTWATTPSGMPWIATTVQQEGPDLWWPTKDQPSDEPDSMALHITVPNRLVVASNGRLVGIDRRNGWATYNWFISTPINAYDVALNIAPYRVIEDTITSVAGDRFPVMFYVLPESYEDGLELFPEILDHLRFFERHLGPYPFRRDKYGVAQTPHLGMEHQSIIAYGANFNNGAMTGGIDWGFDALHHHEMSHEWWGNLVTNVNWNDMWLHEGFGTYMQPLYLEETQGEEAYHAYMDSMRQRITNDMPVAPREVLSAKGIYSGDMYFKGAWILHTLRHLIGDDAMNTALRRMAYPDPEMETVTDGRQTRFATTDDFVDIAEEAAGVDLGWFFEVYLRQPELPALIHRIRDGTLYLQWDVPGGLEFHLPVDVAVNGTVRRVEMPGGNAVVELPAGAAVEIDPGQWALMDDRDGDR